MSIGERIADLRKKQNITQGKLAVFLGVSRQAVSKWENDLSSPDTLNLIRLADLLNTDVEYLATGRFSSDERVPEIQIVEKVVEKPVIRIVEKVVEKNVEIPVVKLVEKPVIKRVYRTRYIRSPMEYILVGMTCFLTGLLLGFFLF